MAMSKQRYDELKGLLETRQREIQAEVQGKNLPQEDLEFALVQMKSETLNKLNEVLARLEEGDYGNCSECREEIAAKRLNDLPFATLCKECDRKKEDAEFRERQSVQDRARMRFPID